MNKDSNLAYDYSRFEEKESKPEIIQTAPKKKPKAHVGARAVSYVLVAAIMSSMLIYSRATQAELEAQYAQTIRDINVIQSENIILQNRLAGELSLKNIEEIAENQLGLKKAENSQIECITFELQNKAEVIKKSTLWDKLVKWISGIWQ